MSEINEQFLSMATSKMVSKPIYVAAKLKIADHIKDGMTAIKDLAQKTKAHEDTLYRVLRALSSVGVFKELEDKNFELTPLAECFLNEPGSQRGMVLWFNDPIHDLAWSHLLWSVETGEPAFNKAYGKPIFDYFKENREISEVFNQAMSANTQGVHEMISQAIDLTGINTLYDIGGGYAHLLKKIMEKHPQLKGGVFDLPNVVADIKDESFEIFPGSFFEEIPTGADAHILTFIIHDWDDESSLTILKNCFHSLPVGGKIFLGENVLTGPNQPGLGKLLDLEMLVMTTGRERTEEEFKILLESAGFKYLGVTPTQGPLSIISAEKF